MLSFVPYSDDYKNALIDIFRSNIPRYFFDYEEKALFEDIPQFPYYIALLNNQPVGAGGYALNEDSDTVSLCWGMIHNNYHKQNLGHELLQFRLAKIKEHYPGKVIVNSTSQHTTGFFEKYGFKTVSVEENKFGPGLHECKMELHP